MIKISEILNYGGACPFQIDALTNDNRRIYGRYRHGYVRVYISKTGDLTDDAAIDGDLIYRHDTGRPYDGYISLEEFKEKTKHILDWSETN
jgi:hypothetical protein